MGQEQPPVYYVTSPTTDTRKRYFPPAIAEIEIANQKSRVSAYEALVTTYNSKVAEYNYAVGLIKNSKIDWFNAIWRPEDYSTASYDMTKPVEPLQPPAYAGLRTVQYTSPTDTTRSAERFWIDGGQGGWGAYSMGLLTLSASMGKSYGLFGSAAKTASKAAVAAITATPAPAYPYVPAYDPAAHGYVSTAAEMTDATSTAKYLIVSVWANTLQATSVVPSGAFTVQFSSNKWGDYGTSSWAAPAAPAAPLAAATLGAKWILPQISILFGSIYQ